MGESEMLIFTRTYPSTTRISSSVRPYNSYTSRSIARSVSSICVPRRICSEMPHTALTSEMSRQPGAHFVSPFLT